MTSMWICKDKNRLYQQAGTDEVCPWTDSVRRNGPYVPLLRLDGTHFWWPVSELEEVTFEMVEKAFVKLNIKY